MIILLVGKAEDHWAGILIRDYCQVWLYAKFPIFELVIRVKN